MTLTRLLAAVAGGGLVAGAAVWFAVGGAEEPERDTADAGGGFRVLRLAEGRAGEVAVSRSDPHRILVRWRGSGDDEWSAPVTAYVDAERFLVSTSARVRGTTLALRASYSTVPPTGEPGPPGVESSVFIACRPRSCTASDHYQQVVEPPCRRGSCLASRPESTGVSQVPELDASGDIVFFGVTERGYAVWEPETGIRELAPAGVPSTGSPGAPILAPDGSFRLVTGQAVPHGCRLTLLVSPAAQPTYTEAAVGHVPSQSGNCATTLETFSDDYVLAHTDRRLPLYLQRRGGAWAQTDQDPSGMMRYRPAPGRTAVGSVVRTGFWHWREVVTASPDGRRLLAQVHFPGSPSWSAPVTVARAPREATCFEIAPTSTPAAEPFYVTMRCYHGTSLRAARSYIAVHAVTEDGLIWHSAIGDDLPIRVGQDLYFPGRPAHRWSPTRGLEQEQLPVGARETSVLVDDGTQILVSVTPQGNRCRLQVRVAEPGATTWSAPIRNEQPYLPPREPCLPHAQYDGDHVSLPFRTRSGRWMPAVIMKQDDNWFVRAERLAG